MSNLGQRTISASIFTVIMVAGMLFAPLFPFLVVFAICWTMHEYYRMAYGKSGDFLAERILAAFTAVLLFTLISLALLGYIAPRFIGVVILPILAMMVVSIWMKDHTRHGRISNVYVGLACIGLPMALVPLITLRSGEHDGLLLLCLFIIIWLCDVGAYTLGSTLGQKPGAAKMAPAISPKKSWWGFAGAIITGILVSVILYFIGVFHLPLVHCMACGLIASAAGVLGDLVESMFKRDFGYKDAGNLIPGHGGLYDRLDSAIVAIPAAAVYLELFGLLG